MALMNAYVDRTRPALGFVDIGIALLNYAEATVHEILGTPDRLDGKSANLSRSAN